MCNIGGGANRCDAHWGESQKAADLAKRRAKYATLKGGTVRQYIQKTATIARSPLGIISTRFSGEQPGKDYFDEVQVAGVLNWTNLDENSYKEFGFKSPEEVRKETLMLDESLMKASKDELSDLSSDEMRGLRFFSSMNYTWLNNILYENGLKDPNLKETFHNTDKNEAFDNLTLSEGESASWVEKADRTPELVSKIITNIDSALDSTPKSQRTLYRGIQQDSFFNEHNSIDSLKVGQEIIFDGYQSSSMSPDIATEFCGISMGEEEDAKPSIIMEIKTSSGLNIIDITEFEGEQEVLLPRNARYAIVGIHKDIDYHTQRTVNAHLAYNSVTVIQMVSIDENGAIL